MAIISDQRQPQRECMTNRAFVVKYGPYSAAKQWCHVKKQGDTWCLPRKSHTGIQQRIQIGVEGGQTRASIERLTFGPFGRQWPRFWLAGSNLLKRILRYSAARWFKDRVPATWPPHGAREWESCSTTWYATWCKGKRRSLQGSHTQRRISAPHAALHYFFACCHVACDAHQT